MTHLEKIFRQLNELLIMNHEVEIIYLEAHDIVNDEDLMTFFRERNFERNEFGRALKREVVKLGGSPKGLNDLSDRYYKGWMKFKELLDTDNEFELLNEISKIKRLNIAAYNKLLQERNLSLSLCKLLVKQRDSIQMSLNSLTTRKATLV